MTLAAMILSVLLRVRPAMLPASLTKMGAAALMGLGIAMCSRSLYVGTVILLVWLAYWLNTDFSGHATKPDSHRPWSGEAAFMLAVLLTFITMIELRGGLSMGQVSGRELPRPDLGWHVLGR